MTSPSLPKTNRWRSTGRITLGDVVYSPGSTFGPRLQHDFQLVVIYTGEAHIQLQDSELYLPPQHTFLMLPRRREFFRFATTGFTHQSWCAITPAALPETLRQRLENLPICMLLSRYIHDLIELGFSVPAGKSASADSFLESIGLALFQAFVFDAETESVNRLPEAVQKAQRYIEAHLDESLDLRGMAQIANVTPQHLTRLFQRHLHITPVRYLWQQRTQRGIELLRETGLSISEIAQRVGFQSPFHFSRLVRRRYAYSPRQLREQIWNSEAHWPSGSTP